LVVVMLELTFEKTAVSYAVALTFEDFKLLLDYENIWHGGLGNGECLSTLIDQAGAYDTDYDGHYLTFIHFSVAMADDTEEFRNTVDELINQRIAEARAWAVTAEPNPAHYHRGRD
jgi:hypothetical protein